MARKKSATAKSSAAAKKSKSSASKPSKKSQPKQHDHEHARHDENEEIDLDDTERKTIDLVLDSDDLRNALETEVNTVVTQAVRKICKAHGASLTVAQSQNVAMVLFGD
ncbi:MAG: hypothetical protein ABSG53_05500 [Thermoguttaceae bacterium]|jgi:hypothetical protein